PARLRVRACELNSMTAAEAPEPTSPFMNALAEFRTAAVAPGVWAIEVDSSSTSTSRVSQLGVNFGFWVTGRIAKAAAAVPIADWVPHVSSEKSLTVTAAGVGPVSGSVMRVGVVVLFGLMTTFVCVPGPFTFGEFTQVVSPLPICHEVERQLSAGASVTVT